jgi:hypothetical protein
VLADLVRDGLATARRENGEGGQTQDHGSAAWIPRRWRRLQKEAIEALYPMLALIHVFLDNARYTSTH